jgi:D-alanyl-D-alanine carboxypeptidase/D-alanyl-D-alanine-endopeptidase (penicillin-binding protein 4)
LPVAGVDGSLADRFTNLGPGARVYAKTGSLGGVKALSGYATTVRGHSVAFSILSNNFNLPNKQVTDTIDNIVEAIVNDGAKK